MPNGRRRRFSVKQEIVLPDPKALPNGSESKNSSDERKQRANFQHNKSNKMKNKFFATGSREPPELDSVIEVESSHVLIPTKALSIDKDVMVTSSNIDFFNILNLTNECQIENQRPQRQETNQIDQTENKEAKSVSRRDKYPRQHRVKVRSPKRRTSIPEEPTAERSSKISESLDVIDWDQELEETVMMNVLSNTNDEQDKPACQENPTSQSDLTNQGNPTNLDNSTNQESPTNQSNLTNQKKISANNLNHNNNRANTIIQSYPVYMTSPTNPNNQGNTLNEINPSNQNHPSNNSLDSMCRICHGSESLSAESGMMISACGCRGTVGRVHVKCLERWLTESGKSRCELCGTRYSTRRVHKYGFPKALAIWVLSQNAKQLMVDSLGIMLMSPLAVVAAWLSGRTLAGLMTPESQQTPWPLASTFVLACMTLCCGPGVECILLDKTADIQTTPRIVFVCYYCWIVSAVTRHALGWWIWYRSQYEVRLQLQENED